MSTRKYKRLSEQHKQNISKGVKEYWKTVKELSKRTYSGSIQMNRKYLKNKVAQEKDLKSYKDVVQQIKELNKVEDVEDIPEEEKIKFPPVIPEVETP